MTLSPTLRAKLAAHAAPEFVVADRVELSLVGCADREGRKFDMREWCRDNCAFGFRQRWSGADAVAFEFEKVEDGVPFRLRWR
jgi:hypothetical protein